MQWVMKILTISVVISIIVTLAMVDSNVSLVVMSIILCLPFIWLLFRLFRLFLWVYKKLKESRSSHGKWKRGKWKR